jgi:exosortase A-associated hydrolase 1
MDFEERALSFNCGDCHLYGILSHPQQAATRGVLIVVGGPQYRAGSHRQFTLLARHLAGCGVPVLRFDYRGMGDSEGAQRSFEDVGEDLRAAADCFMREVPGMRELVIWGLCDAASAALFYAHQDARVTGLVLANPWVRTGEGAAKAYLKHYYLARLFEPGFWRKLMRGGFDFQASVRSFSGMARDAFLRRKEELISTGTSAMSLPDRMYEGLRRFQGRVLVIRSGNDLTAREFSDLIGASCKWCKLMRSERVRIRDLPGADHTFSRREWRDRVAGWTQEWVREV